VLRELQIVNVDKQLNVNKYIFALRELQTINVDKQSNVNKST
jgi:hypothetical protein